MDTKSFAPKAVRFLRRLLGGLPFVVRNVVDRFNLQRAGCIGCHLADHHVHACPRVNPERLKSQLRALFASGAPLWAKNRCYTLLRRQQILTSAVLRPDLSFERVLPFAFEGAEMADFVSRNLTRRMPQPRQCRVIKAFRNRPEVGELTHHPQSPMF